MPMSFEDFQRLRKLFGGMGGPIGAGQAIPTAPTQVRARGPVGARPTTAPLVSTPAPPAALYPNYRPLDVAGQAQLAAGVAVPSRLPSGQPVAAFNLDYGLLPGSAQLIPGMAPVGLSPVNPKAPYLAQRTAGNFPFLAAAAGVTEGGVPYDENGIPIVTGPTGPTAELLNPQPNPAGGGPPLGFIPNAINWGAGLLPESVTGALRAGLGKGMEYFNIGKNWEEERTGGMMYETAKSGTPQQPRDNWAPTIWASGPRQRYMTPDEPGYTPGKMVEDPGWFNEWALDNPDAVIAAYEDGYTPETGAYAGQALTGDRAVWELFINQQDQTTRGAMALLMDPATAVSAAGLSVPSLVRSAEAAELLASTQTGAEAASSLSKARWLRGIATTIEAAEFATEAPVAAPARVLGAVAPPLGRATGRVAGAAGTGIESRFPGLGQAARRAGAFGQRVGGVFVNPAPETAAADFSQRYGGELAQIEAARVRAEDLQNLATGGPPPRGAEPPGGPPGEGPPDLVPSLFGGGPAAPALAPTAPAPTVAVTTAPAGPQPRGYSRQRLSDGSWVVINPRGEVEQHIGNEFAWEAGRDPAEMADEFIAGLERGEIAPLPRTPTITEVEQQLTGVPTPQQQASVASRNPDVAPGWTLRRMNLASGLADDPAAAARIEQLLLPHATTLEQTFAAKRLRDVDLVIEEGRFAAESRIAYATEGRQAPDWRLRFDQAPRQRRNIDVPKDAAKWETVETLPSGQLVATMENPAKLIERLIHERSTALTAREREVLRATGVIQSNPVRASLQDEILNARLLTSKKYPDGSLTIRNMPGQGYQKYDNVRLAAMSPAERQAVAAAAIAEKTAAYQRWQRIVDVRTRLHGPEAPQPAAAAGPIDEDVAPIPAAPLAVTAVPPTPATAPVTVRPGQAPTNAAGVVTPPGPAPVAGNAEAIASLQNDLAVMEGALARESREVNRLRNRGITGPRYNQARQAETASKREVDRIRADLARLQPGVPPAQLGTPTRATVDVGGAPSLQADLAEATAKHEDAEDRMARNQPRRPSEETPAYQLAREEADYWGEQVVNLQHQLEQQAPVSAAQAPVETDFRVEEIADEPGNYLVYVRERAGEPWRASAEGTLPDLRVRYGAEQIRRGLEAPAAALPPPGPLEADLFHGSPVSDLDIISASRTPEQRAWDNAASELGAFFTPDEAEARYFARDKNVYPAHVRLTNAYPISADEFFRRFGAATEAARADARAFRARLEAEGYDGIAVWSQGGELEEVAVFSDVSLTPAAPAAAAPQAVGAAQPGVRLTPAGNELTGGPNRVWHVARGDQRVEIYQPPGEQFRITGAGGRRRTPTLSEALVVADDMLAAPAPAAAAPAPRIVQTPQGPQAQMDLGTTGRPVFGGPGGGFEVPPQTTAAPLELQLQVEPTPEAQRQAEVLAGQTDMFGEPAPAPAAAQPDLTSAGTRKTGTAADDFTFGEEGSYMFMIVPGSGRGDFAVMADPPSGRRYVAADNLTQYQATMAKADLDKMNQARAVAAMEQPGQAVPAAARETVTGDIPFVESQGVKSYDVPVAQIKTDPTFQPRQQLNPEHVARIRDKYNRDLFEPITIWRNPADNQYYVLAGHHRLQAVRELGHAEVPARIFEGDEAAAKQFADRSNLHAAEQSVLENAGVIKREMEERGASYKQLASELGLKSANEAEQLHNLAYLPATIRTVFEGGGMRKAQAARFGAAVREGRLEAEHVLQIFQSFDQTALNQLNVGQIDNALAGVEHLRGQQAGLFPLGPETPGGAPTLPGFAPSESDRILKDMIDLGARLTKLQTLEKRLGQVGRLGETTGVPVETSGALEAARAKIREISERLGRSYFVNPDVGRLGQVVGPRTTVSGIPPAPTGNAELVDLAETVGLPPQAAADFSRMVTYEEEQLPLIAVYDRYKDLVAEAHPELTPSEVSAEAQRRFMGFLNEVPDIGRPQDYDPNRFLKGWDTLGENARAAIMYNIVTGPRGILGDWIGDNLLSTLSHGVDVFPSMNDPATIRAAGIFQYTGSQDAIRELPETHWLNDLGIAEYDRSIVNVRGGKAELKADDLMPLARGATKIPGFRTGIGRKVARTVVEPFQSELLRSGRSTLDLARRIGLFGHVVHREFPAAANRFRRLVIQESERLDYNAGDLWNGIMAQAQTRVQGQGRVWTQQFDPADVTNALRAQGITDTSLPQAWANEVRGLVEEGKSAVNRTLFSYRQMNVDKQLGRLIFFNYWQSRALVSWSRLALKHPAIGMHFARAYQGMEREAEEQGYPSSVRGWMGFMGDKGAFWSFFDPISMLTPYSMFRDTAPREDQRGWEKALSKWHVFMAPQLQAAANLMGWGTSAVDPTGTYSVRNTVRAVIDYDRNHGNHLGLGAGITEDKFNSLVNGVFSTASHLVDKYTPIPFSEEIDQTNPKATEIAQVNNIILSTQEDKYGPASTWEEQYDVLDENGVPTNRVINETLEAENAIRLDRADGNELAEAALARWSGQGLKSTGLRSAIPGGVRTFFGPQERQRELKNQGFAAVAEGATPTPEEQAGMAWWEAGTAGTERGAEVGMQQQQYADLGTERQQTAAGRWNAIAFATLQPGEEIMITGLHGNEVYSNTSLSQMTQEERENIADQWVEGFRATEGLAELRDTQSAFRAQNPEFDDLKEWQATARDYEDEHGTGSWRREMSRVSPSYRAYINNLPGSLSKAELDKKAISADAYTAYLGEQQTIYETSVPPRLDIGQADPALFMQGGAGAGGGGGEKDYTGDDVAYLESELADYMQKQQEYENAVMSMTGGQAVDNPFFKTALDEELRMRGISEPRMPAIVENYASWIRLQQPGADLSPAAYIAWRDAQEAALVGQFAQPGGALAQFQQQYSQPYAAP